MSMFVNEMYMFTLLDVIVFFWHNKNVKVKVKACKEHRHHQYQIFILLFQFLKE